MSEIEEVIDKAEYLPHNGYHGNTTKRYSFTKEQLMRLIELVEEEQANYILDRIQDDYKEPTKWVSQQLKGGTNE